MVSGRGEQFKGNHAIGLATSIRQITHLTQKHAYNTLQTKYLDFLKLMGSIWSKKTSACLAEDT